MNDSQILMAGVPQAGKTSYLAVLNLAIIESRGTRIQLESFEGDREYLNDLTSRLIKCEDAVHTEVSKVAGLNLSIVLPSGDKQRLMIPDLSGETWLETVAEHTWTPELRNLVTSADGICVFLNVDDLSTDPPISLVLQGELGDMVPSDPQEFPTQTTQVQLVELLQIVSDRPGRPERRISLILSAFDTVPGITPRAWLDMSVPLVCQYLEMNADWLHVEVFGLSAQGGSFSAEPSRVDLLGREALDRAFILNSEGKTSSFDAPLLWVMRLE